MGLTACRRAGTSVAVGLAALALAAWPVVAHAEASIAFTIGEPAVTRSSGLTRDTNTGSYWTVNDSGDGGTVYALSPTGRSRGTLTYRAKPVDVEAIAMHGSQLFVADIGDKTASRSMITVYSFDYPQPGATPVSYHSYDFTYPDGPRDAETLLIDPTGRLFIVTTGASGAIYAAPPAPSRTGTNRLEKVGDAPAGVTDGVFWPNGSTIMLRTSVSVEVLDPSSYAVVARAAAPVQPQGESIAASLDGTSLLLGSKGRFSKVYRMAPPTDLDAVPTATGSPSASGSSSPAASTEADAGASDETGRGRAGTWLALGLAAVVAVVAGVVVGVVKRP